MNRLQDRHLPDGRGRVYRTPDVGWMADWRELDGTLWSVWAPDLEAAMGFIYGMSK